MPKKLPNRFKMEVASRLAAVQAELGKTDGEMAKLVGTGRSSWANWKSAGNKPDEEAMCALYAHAKIPLEWLYCGDTSRMEVSVAVRLTARLLGQDPQTATPQVLLARSPAMHRWRARCAPPGKSVPTD